MASEEGYPPTPPLLVGGSLASRWSRWKALGAEPWTVTTLRRGYRIPFLDERPPLSPQPIWFRSYKESSHKDLALQQVVQEMLDKGALEIVQGQSPGFYSRLFLVEKATGGWRPVIDLSPLNGFIRQTPFKMETAATVLSSVRKGDFMASIDLKDAYFQIPVHRNYRKFLRFVCKGVVYQFKVLCFGLSTAPQVFTRVFELVSKWAHSQGIRLIRYLDDWLVLADSRLTLERNVGLILHLCSDLGIVVNREKSDLTPSQQVKHLGMLIDSVSERAFPSETRIEKFKAVSSRFLTGDSQVARSCWATCLLWKS